MIGAHACGRVGLQLTPAHTRCVAVDVVGERDLRKLRRVPGDHARKVHHLGDAEDASPPEQRFEIALRERPAGRLVHRRRHARRRGEVDVERTVGRRVEEPVDAVGAEHVRDLVRVRDDGRRPERKHEAGELVRQELRRLDVHVRVDEARDDVLAARVHDLVPVVLAEAGDPAVRDRDIHVEPFAREDGEDAPAAHDHVGWLVAARDGETPGELGLRRHARSFHARAVRLARGRAGTAVAR